jgi:hypothetical protein
MVQIGRDPDHTSFPYYRFLVRSHTVAVALAQAISAIVPISDLWGEIHTSIRPLKAFEVIKVTLKEGEVIELDDASYIHLTNGEQDD